eukprot:12398387-Karenia_brevis.AAC.1
MPNGLSKCDSATVARWTKDKYRYSPYQYVISNLVASSKGLRPLTANEREVRLGFEWGHTASALHKSEAKARPAVCEDVRCSLLGNSFSCPVVGWLFGHFLYQQRLLPTVPSIAQAWSMEAAGKATKQTLDDSKNAGKASKHALGDSKRAGKATKLLESDRTCDPWDARTSPMGMATKRRVTAS